MKPPALSWCLLLIVQLALAAAGPARSEAAARGQESFTWSVEAVLSNPAQIDVYDSRFLAFSRKNRDRLVPGLKATAPDQAPAVRLLIAQFLLHLGDPEATSLLLEGLAHGDRDDQQRTLVALSLPPFEAAPGQTVKPDEAAVLPALLPFLKHPDPRFRSLAADGLLQLSIPAAVEQQKALLTHRDPELRKKAALQRANRFQDPAAWPIIRRALAETGSGESHARFFLLFGLVDLCGTEDSAVRAEVIEAVVAEIERGLERADNEASNEVSNLMGCFEVARSPQEAEVLERIAASDLEDWTRGFALIRLSELEGEAGFARLESALDDASLRPSALGAFVDREPDAVPTAVVDKVRSIFEETDDQILRGLAYDAMVALGAGQDPALGRYLEELDPVRRFEASARHRKVSAEEMLNALTAAALAPEAPNDASASFLESWPGTSPWSALFELLYDNRRIEVFDAEDGFVPPNYVSLLHGLAEIAEPDIEVTKIALQPYAEDGKHRLSLRMEGQTVEFLVADYGDWFDIAGLLAGLNGGLAEGGSELRFVALYSADQLAFVIFGNGKGIQRLAHDYGFPLAADPDESMRTGQEIERRVLEELRNAN